MRDSPNLDALRSIAIAMVVLSHLGGVLGWDGERFYSLETFGRLGVAVFFVHTSLVLMLSLDRTGEGAAPFLVRRCLRIYPLAGAIVLVAAGLQLALRQPVDGWQLASNLLLVQNITGHPSTPAPLWSLPYELQMYLLLPALYALTLLPAALRWMALIWGASLALVLLAWLAAPQLADLVKYAPCFLPGVLAFILGRRGPGRHHPALLLALLAVAALAVPALVAAGASEIVLLWALCLALGLTIPACRQIRSAGVARLSKVIATYSYGAYLTHPFAIMLAFVVLGPAPAAVQWAVFIVMLGGLSHAAYHGIEKHGIALGVRLASRVGAASTNAVPPRIIAP